MAYGLGLLCFFGFLVIISLLMEASALDSEIVEAQSGGVNSTDLNKTAEINLVKIWNSNGTMQAQPYNILEANCPHGYVLANKHCHKRA
ncbi:uncharacterized protein LOC121530505 [Drosophila eugracilis]|uniref:uncharacterized protein LOC121530505 n=1 Tax=Drosophila eugracilis TaxID=29029 RepID=UPI001BDAF9E6|nr:uncharacterized protein LOC121530505 [Drosophila eugracilis]